MITSCAKLEVGQTEVSVCQNPVGHHTNNLDAMKSRFLRQPSSDEGCYTHSSTSNTSSSAGSGNGSGKYKMSAALTQAMVTAAIPVARPAPAAGPGHKPSKAIPEIQATLRHGWQKTRSITVIEEVSA